MGQGSHYKPIRQLLQTRVDFHEAGLYHLDMARLLSDFRMAPLRASGPRAAPERVYWQVSDRSTRGLFMTMTYLELDAVSGEFCR